MTPVRLVALALLAGLAACAQGERGTLPPAAGQVTQKRPALARLVIDVPPAPKKAGHRSRYVSASTAKLAYSVDGVVMTPVVIATGSPNCAIVSSSYLRCTVTLSLAPGTHVLSFTAEDANGVALSRNTNVLATIQTGITNQISVTLGGIAASLSVIPLSSLAVSGSQATGAIKIVGNAPQGFQLQASDADGRVMIGPGVPQPFVKATPASMTFASPVPQSNVWTLASTFTTATNPTVPLISSLAIEATPVPGSGGGTVNTTIPMWLYQPWIFVADDANNSVLAFDEKGNPKTLPHPITAQGPEGLIYDAHNGLLYVGSETDNAVGAVRPDGSTYTLQAASPFAGLSAPTALAFDSKSNEIYVMEYTASGGSVAAFDEQGNAQTLSGTFSGVVSSYGFTYDPNNDWFYVANCIPNAMKTFTSQGAAVTLTGSFPNLSYPSGVAFDPDNDWLYVTNCNCPGAVGKGTVTAYDEQGHQQTLSGNPSGIPTAWGIVYDPYNKRFYVANDADGALSSPTLTVYDGNGTLQSLAAGTFGGLAWPSDIAVVP